MHPHLHTHTRTQTHTLTHTKHLRAGGLKKKVFEKRIVFREDLKELTEDAWRIEAGSLFHVVGAWSEKERWPLDFVRKKGILNNRVLKEGILNTRVSAEERSCREGV